MIARAMTGHPLRCGQASAPFRLVLVQPQAENAGAQEIARLLAGELGRRGHQVHQAFFYRKTAAFDNEPGVTFCAPERPRGLISVTATLARLVGFIRRTKPDAVLCFQHYGNTLGSVAARLAGAPVVIANQNSARRTTPGVAQVVDRCLGTLGVYTRIVVNSHESAGEFADKSSLYRKRLIQIDHGFASRDSTLSRAAARGSFGLPAEATLLGCVARLHRLKNLSAAVRLLALEPSWRVAFAGQGPERETLVALAAELGCADRLHLVGEIPPGRVGDFLAALDVFVFPTRAESFGLAAAEAAQAGLPVVAHDLPVLREVLQVEGDPCALFVDVDDAEQFRVAVRRVLDEPALAAGLSARGRRLQERFPIARMADRYEALIADLVHRPAAERPLARTMVHHEGRS